MRKVLIILLCLCLLCPGAKAAEAGEKYVALTFDGEPSGPWTQRLLEGLKKRDARATFLLCGRRLEQFPELAQTIADENHEIGLYGYDLTGMAGMSRRAIAQALSDTRAMLPKGANVNFFRPPDGYCTDAVRQVAEVTNLSILSWSVDPRTWTAAGTRIAGRVYDGDVVTIHSLNGSTVDAVLSMVDQLQKQGFQFVTASELAKLRKIRLKSGETYVSFPPKESSDTGF